MGNQVRDGEGAARQHARRVRSPEKYQLAALNGRTLSTSFLLRGSNADSPTAVTAMVSPSALNTSIE